MQLVGEHEMHQTPLDVLVIDMDWHITFYKEVCSGVVGRENGEESERREKKTEKKKRRKK